MPLVLGNLTALITLAGGILAAVVGAWLCWSRSHDIRVAGNISTYGFSVTPLAILVWNCCALLVNDFNGQAASTLPVSLGFDLVLISYAAIYSFFHVTADIISTVRNGR